MKWLVILSILFASPALAQQQSATPNEQALSNRLLKEISSSLTCEATTVTLQADLAKAQARIKELEEKK